LKARLLPKKEWEINLKSDDEVIQKDQTEPALERKDRQVSKIHDR
jgi:hypothetical protein